MTIYLNKQKKTLRKFVGTNGAPYCKTMQAAGQDTNE